MKIFTIFLHRSNIFKSKSATNITQLLVIYKKTKKIKNHNERKLFLAKKKQTKQKINIERLTNIDSSFSP